MKQAVIIGSGFGGLTAARTLRKLKTRVDITLISPAPRFEYLPSTIWIPFGLRNRADLEIPLDNFFSRFNINYIPSRVTGLIPDKNKVITLNGAVDYDYLIIACGAKFIKKIPGVKEHAIIPCEGITAAEKFKEHLFRTAKGTIAFGFSGNPKDPIAMRGGPVFEFLFSTDTWLKKQGRRDNFDLVFLSPAPRPGQRLGNKAVGAIMAEMKKRNIKTCLGEKITRIEKNQISTETTSYNADIILFMPGITGAKWLEKSGLILSDGGFIKADKYARAIERENVFAAGDCGSFPGPDWFPKQGHMADLQAEAAAKNIHNLINGGSVNHTFKVELACIIDSLNKGSLVYRSEKRALMVKSRLLHYAKSSFEKLYLRKIR